MRGRIRTIVKNVAQAAGYDVRRLENAGFPYLRSAEVAGQAFQFWIASECGRLWYEETPHLVEPEARELLRLVRPGDKVLEIGCHHGFFTMLLAKVVGPGGFVCGVEASPENALVAQAQITLNALGAGATVLHAAGSDRSGSVTVGLNNGGNNHVISGKGINVSAVTGDDLDDEFGPFDVVKLDVEGYEAKVLKGCRGLLERRPRVAIEIHPLWLAQYGSSVAEVLELLNVARYSGVMFQRPIFALKPLSPDDIARSPEPVNVFLEAG